jgi:glutamate-1-semialdehyde 2,1-aminomutase
VPAQINRVGSILTCFFAEHPVTDYESAKKSDTVRYARFFRAMLREGIYLAPSQFEAAFLSVAHTEEDVDRAADAATRALRG